MTENHPITPTLKLFRKWTEYRGTETEDQFWWRIATQATQWGADYELEKCCEVLNEHNPSAYWGELLRSRRRPKPPSLREQALALLDPSLTYGSITREDEYRISVAKAEIIRRALEQLPE